MRAAILALLLMTTPALAEGQCKFYNRIGQSLVWTGESVIVDVLYIDAFICPLKPIPDTDAYLATCGTWTEKLVVGYADNPQNADALVWGDVFFWRRCEKDHA